MKKVCIAVVTLVSVVIIATTSVGRTDVNISVPETNKYTNISDNTESSTEVMTTAVKKSKEVMILPNTLSLHLKTQFQTLSASLENP